jgi:hypothetical protein
VLADVAVNPEAPITPKKLSLLPLLTVLFILSYGLMTLLIVEQGATIESQRGLIKEMLRDSVELSAMKGKAIQDKYAADSQRRANAQAHAPLTQAPSTQTPSTQAPSIQTPSAQMPMTKAPSTQVAPNHNVRNEANKTQKPRFQAPSRPASDLADARRIVIMI